MSRIFHSTIFYCTGGKEFLTCRCSLDTIFNLQKYFAQMSRIPIGSTYMLSVLGDCAEIHHSPAKRGGLGRIFEVLEGNSQNKLRKNL
jgi:hypothetical protein